MDEVSHLQREISDLTNILSLITKRAPEFETDDEASVPEIQGSEASIIDIEVKDEHVDETEFEAPVAQEDVEVHAIKRGALDRLAEVLARFKTGKSSRGRQKQNSDAKHVASVVMVEEGKSVIFFCSKNEGLDTVDMEFLKRLESLLREIIAAGARSEQTEHINQVFDILFDHLGPRISYYSEILRDAMKNANWTAEPMTLSNRNVQECLPQAASRDWEDNNGLHFKFQLDGVGEDAVSDKAEDCLSDREEEISVQEAYSEILHLFGDSAQFPVPQAPMKTLLKKVYHIVRHPRQRPVLKGLLRQLLQSEKRFKVAWDSLLYLTRIFYAAVIFADLATRLGLVSIQFQHILAPQIRKPKKSDKRTPVEVLESFGYSLPTRNWRDFFQGTTRVEEFIQRSSSKNTVHAEVQLIFHLENIIHNGNFTSKVYPYIGCSRKCCFFCDLFRIQHGTFEARGTHLTLFPQWSVPQKLPKQSLPILRQFSKQLRDFLRIFFSMPGPLPPKDLIKQSSAALSTAQVVQREAPIYSTRPQALNKLMLGFGGIAATEFSVEFMPIPEQPGYASLMGGPQKPGHRTLPIEEAEMAKANHERKVFALEKVDEMPPTKSLDQQLCRRCHDPARYKCSVCWTGYCSRTCQKRNWASHVFVCSIPRRPNDVDFFRLVIRKVERGMTSRDNEKIHNSLLYLLADDYICRTFGFNNCEQIRELVDLVCLYTTILSRVRPVVLGLQKELESGSLSTLMEKFCQVERQVAQITKEDECPCVTWFLKRYSLEPFLAPNMDRDTYGIWETSVALAIHAFDLEDRLQDEHEFDASEADVFSLYVALQPTIRQLPDIYSSSWIQFGFCYCKSFEQRSNLASKYLELSSSATFDDIVSAYKTSSLEDLMRTHGVDISELGKEGVRLRSPSPREYSVYRLMAGVEHALSGRRCSCFTFREGRKCHRYFETHLDTESDLNFGFHLTSSWERWQMLNFYKYLFHLPEFDPRHMAQAKEAEDVESLENYLNGLVPGMREKISDRYRTNILFPRLKDRLDMTMQGKPTVKAHLPCTCKEHDVIGPPGYARNIWRPAMRCECELIKIIHGIQKE